jgi:phage protein D
MSDIYLRSQISAQSAKYNLSDDLTSLSIEEDDQLADKLTVVVPDPFKVFSYALQEGMDVEVDLGWVDDHSVLFRGLITKVDVSFPEDAVPQVTLIAFDNSIRLGMCKRNRQWTDIDLQGIVSKIALDGGFYRQEIKLPSGGNPSYTGNGIWQQEKTDLDFLHELADRQHCKVFVDAEDLGDKFFFKPEQTIMDAEPTATIYYGRCGVTNRLLSFSINSDVSQRQRPQAYASIDPETGQETTAERQQEEPRDLMSTPYDANLAAFSQHEPVKAAALKPLLEVAAQTYQKIFKSIGDEERVITSGLFNAKSLKEQTTPQPSTVSEGITGEGVTEGNKDLRAKRNIQIESVGGRFSGKWYLSQVRHVVDGNGYHTHFTGTR